MSIDEIIYSLYQFRGETTREQEQISHISNKGFFKQLLNKITRYFVNKRNDAIQNL